MAINPASAIETIGAVGALGTAASGLVDITKLFAGGVSRVGFETIKKQLRPFSTMLNAVPDGAALETIYGLWINGAAIEDQKAKTKAMIKLGLRPDTVPAMATATGLPILELTTLAQNIVDGIDLTPAQVNIYGQLDAVLSVVIDAAYEKADQHYRNAAKFLSAAIAVVLAVVGGYAVYSPFDSKHLLLAIVIGAVATPLAPVAKDLTTAINTAVQASGKLQSLLK